MVAERRQHQPIRRQPASPAQRQHQPGSQQRRDQPGGDRQRDDQARGQAEHPGQDRGRGDDAELPGGQPGQQAIRTVHVGGDPVHTRAHRAAPTADATPRTIRYTR